MKTAPTAITIVGNAAVFDARGEAIFFVVEQAVALAMSDVALQNGNGTGGGAIFVQGTTTLSDCNFIGNTAALNYGGAIWVNYGAITSSDFSSSGNTADDGGGGGYGGAIGNYAYGGTTTLSDCSFSVNTAGGGGALYFSSGNTNGLLKNCSLLGTVSPNNNAIARYDTSANATFACADGEVGTPVQMQGNEIAAIPAQGAPVHRPNTPCTARIHLHSWWQPLCQVRDWCAWALPREVPAGLFAGAAGDKKPHATCSSAA
jgi:hypothetical protein